MKGMFKRITLLAATLVAAAALLAGCSGSDGSNGANGTNGANGANGANGTNGKDGLDRTLGVVDAQKLTVNDLRNVALAGNISEASIPGNNPVVKFSVYNKANGQGIVGLRSFSLHVAQLKPEANGTSSYWLNYIADGLPITAMPATTSTAITNPSTDAVTSFNADGTVKAQGYKIVDNLDGTYTATFGANIKANTKVPYDGSLIHRIVVGVRSVATPGNYRTPAGTLSPATATAVTPGAYPGPVVPETNAVMGAFVNTNGTALTYDFYPGTGAAVKDASGKNTFARDIVTIAACNQCHTRLEYGSNNTSGHFGSRPDTKVCVVCHTNQLDILATSTSGAGPTVGTGNFTMFIHQIHMGEELPAASVGLAQTGASASDVKYPQDVRNCTMCHKGADVNNWMSKPTLNACGSCHNGINFATGKGTTNAGETTGHVGGAQSSNNTCAVCHDHVQVSGYHLPVVPPDPSSAVAVYAGAPYKGVFSAYSAAYQANGRIAPGSPNSNTNAAFTAAASLSRLPAGAKQISYVINSVSRNASKQPVMVFKFQVATADANGVLGTPVDVVFNDPAAKKELIDGFVGSPSVYFAFAVPQDGIAKPVDYNATISGYLKRIWNGTATTVSGAAAAATLTGPVSGNYTITFTGQTVPDSAVMLTGGIGYTYGVGSAMTKLSGTNTYAAFASTTQPLTQTDLAAYPYTQVVQNVVGLGGLSVPADNKWKVATGYTGRRVITDNAKCNACHGRLGVKPTFHAGQRNDAPTCTFCHNVNRTNSGWAVNIKEDVHAIHGAGKRVNKFSWEASAGAKYWEVGYPGTLKNCEMCHVPGMYDFSNAAYTGANSGIFDSMLYTYNASGTMPASINVILTGTEAVPGAYYSPFVTAGAVYGATFAYSAATGVTTPAAATTLVTSPISSACFTCHDTKLAKAHMEDQGGSIYAPQATALAKKELCIICHGAVSTTNATNYTTPTIKAVHRWW